MTFSTTSIRSLAAGSAQRVGFGVTALAIAGTMALSGCGGSKAGSAVSSAAGGDPSIQTSSTTTTSTDAGSSTTSSTGTQHSTGTQGTTGTQGGSSSGTGSSTGTGSASSTASSSHQGATPVTMDNLPPASTVHLYDMSASTTGSGSGAGQSPTGMCQTQGWNVSPEFSRTYSLRGSSGLTARAGVDIASFPSHDAAVTAAHAMASSFQCRTGASAVDGVMKDTIKVENSTVTLNNGSAAHRTILSYAAAQPKDAVNEEQTGVMVTGTHVAVVTLVYTTQDYDKQSIVQTMNAMLPYVAK